MIIGHYCTNPKRTKKLRITKVQSDIFVFFIKFNTVVVSFYWFNSV